MEQATRYPFQDHTLDVDTRVHDLVSRLNEDEKIESMLQYQPAVERLAISGYKHGTEAAHGIAWLGEATFFPQPVGLACTWDADLMKRIGNVISDEARVMYKRNPEINGLTLWAPTVDMERDPRWGRNEEAYGEDPKLTGELTSHLVQGIQGDHPAYLKAVATLKHFIGNNNEIDRGSGSSSIDPRNMREYYLKAFEQPFREGGAQSMMTSYNSINGTPTPLHPLVQQVVKGEWGMDGFIVSDAADIMGIMRDHHYYDSHTPGVAGSVKAGIDSITDDAELTKAALREALEQGILSWDDIDQALCNTFRVRFRLGEFDPEDLNPYAAIGEESMMTEQARATSAEAARKSIVLLKNNDQTLPLSKTSAGTVAVIGELGSAVYRDWYSGTLPYTVSALEGIRSKAAGDVRYHDGNDRVTFKTEEGSVLSVQNDPASLQGQINRPENTQAAHLAAADKAASADKEIPEALLKVTSAKLSHSAAAGQTANEDRAQAPNDEQTFIVSDWGFGSYTIRSQASGKFWTADDDHDRIDAVADEAYGWFVKEVFGMETGSDGKVKLSTWNGRAVYADEEQGQLRIASEAEYNKQSPLICEYAEKGLEQAAAAAKQAETAIVFVGNNPLINGKEEVDRPGLELPASQLKLIQEVYAANPNTVVVVVGSYPFAMEWVEEHIPAILYLSHAGPELGNAVADVLYGDYAPSGRLNMTWYRSEAQLGDLLDYDIIRSERTYQYFTGDPLYPFGHGLTYASMEYSDLQLSEKGMTMDTANIDSIIELSVTVRNTGEVDSDEVVQLYSRQEQSRVKRPHRTLQAFQRVHIQAGESQTVTLRVPVQELALWDVTRDRYCIERGTYTFMVGRSSADIQLQTEIQLQGETIPARDGYQLTRAENYDDYSSVHLVEQKLGIAAVEAREEGAWLLFQDMDLRTAAVHFKAHIAFQEQNGKVQLYLDQLEQESIAVIHAQSDHAAALENGWQSVQMELEPVSGRHDVFLKLSKGVQISEFQFGKAD